MGSAMRMVVMRHASVIRVTDRRVASNDEQEWGCPASLMVAQVARLGDNTPRDSRCGLCILQTCHVTAAQSSTAVLQLNSVSRSSACYTGVQRKGCATVGLDPAALR